jgi:cell wall-associated NlpC family hydrolase
MSNHWATSYIGIPYLEGGRHRIGLDCWGLLRLVYLDHEGIELPLLPGITEKNILTISREVVEQLESYWTELPCPLERSGVAMSLQTVPHHVGIWTNADGGKVLHAWNGNSVVAETLRSLKTRGMRTIKFYRYGIHH